MLMAADVSVQEVLRYFTQRGIDVGLLVPTATGMAKGIMDATENVRGFLRGSGIHDYASQPQGTEHKRRIATRVVTSAGIVGTTTSLYRPTTKHGDPRLWVYGLPQHAEPGNLLVLVALGRDELLVINASNAGLVPGVNPPSAAPLRIGDTPSVNLEMVLAPLLLRQSDAANELLAMLRAISGQWHEGLPGIRRDTEVGRLLEQLLGIEANSSKSPDYKGIEIKAGRSRSESRQTLFGKVPDWSSSRLKSSAAVLEAFGYSRSSKYQRQLRCTVSAKGPNSQGLFLLVAEGQGKLVEASKRPDMPDVVTWPLDGLKEALQQKHPETFWVSASSRAGAAAEEFRYDHVLHTRKPMVNSLPALLETGVVTVDHLITKNLKGRIREQGPLFRIWRKDMDLLFPPGDYYSLI